MSIERIIIHWDGGNGNMSEYLRKYYHFMVDKNANTYSGKYKPEDNINTSDNEYCPHVGGLNTGAIGVAVLGMHGFDLFKTVGDYEINRKQMEACFSLVAKLCHKYNLEPVDNVVNTHAEIGVKVLNGEIKRTPLTALNVGKQDILFLPYKPNMKPDQVGEYIRNKINWYYKKIKKDG